MKISEVKNNYVFTTRIDLNEDGSEYIVLREPNTQEISGLSEDGQKNLEAMNKIFANCVIESSITDDDGNPADGKTIHNALKESGSLFTEILETWITSVPFRSRLAKPVKSGK